MENVVETPIEVVDPRVKRTRELIVNAFRSLLGEKEFEEISVQDVATRATINRATFYSHFADKSKILDYSVSKELHRQLALKFDSSSKLNQENLEVLVITVCEFLSGLRKGCSRSFAQLETLIESPVHREVYNVLYSWIAPLQKRACTTPELAATVTSWGIFGAALQWSKEDNKQTAEELAHRLLGLLVGGLSSLTDLDLPKLIDVRAE